MFHCLIKKDSFELFVLMRCIQIWHYFQTSGTFLWDSGQFFMGQWKFFLWDSGKFFLGHPLSCNRQNAQPLIWPNFVDLVFTKFQSTLAAFLNMTRLTEVDFSKNMTKCYLVSSYTLHHKKIFTWALSQYLFKSHASLSPTKMSLFL